ncbi:hypothetical protein Q7P36_001433 [Cladosporium allicinum]
MKFSTTTMALLAGTAAAMPATVERRQFGLGGTGSTANELSGACKQITFIFARGSTEIGNMGSTVGPPTCDGLKKAYNDDVACQGVGGAYKASVGSNALPGGTTAGSYNEAISIFEDAAQKCPDTIIVAAGYSQGAAVMVNAVSKLDPSVQERVAGVVLYGNTRNKQENGKIPNFPLRRRRLTATPLMAFAAARSSSLPTQISAQGSASSSSSSASTGTSSSSAVTTTKASSGLGGLSGWSGIFGN